GEGIIFTVEGQSIIFILDYFRAKFYQVDLSAGVHWKHEEEHELQLYRFISSSP
ncbi:unnamed protein product, partial [Allacma fusca]